MKSTSRKLIALLLALLMSLSLMAGCGSTKTDVQPTAEPTQEVTQPTQEPEKDPEPEQTQEPEAEPEVPYTVTDMMGAEVTFEKVPETIATFGSIGVLNTFVEALGCGDRICNKMTKNFESTKSYPNLRLAFAPQTESAPLLVNDDGELLMEEILMLNPDLCLTMTKATAEQLREQGLNVIYLEWKEQDDVYTAVRLMGKVLGKEDLAEDYLAYFDDMVAKAEELTAGIPEDERKTVLYGSITSFSQPHIIAEWWITEAGGISVTNNDRPSTESYNYTAEDVLMWDPDVMLVSGRNQIEELKANEAFAGLKAVQNDAIYCVPTVGHAWGNRTVEQPLTIFWTINKLYPELVSDQELSDQIYYFYDHFFNYQLSAEQLATYVEGK